MIPLKAYAYAGLALALLGFAYWAADKIGDSRELAVIEREKEQKNATDNAELEGRNRARACHALGPDCLWNAAKGTCEFRPVRSTGAGTCGG